MANEEHTLERLFDKVSALEAASNFGRGATRAILVILGLTQAIAVSVLAWMLLSIIDLRESKGVLDYRLTRIERLYDNAQDQPPRSALFRRP